MADNGHDAWLALAGTIFGGAGLEIIRRALSKTKEREDYATAIRNELRADLTAVKEEVALLEKELDQWKSQYYTLWEKFIMTEAKLLSMKPKNSDGNSTES